jgi:hypothetical protein
MKQAIMAALLMDGRPVTPLRARDVSAGTEAIHAQIG